MSAMGRKRTLRFDVRYRPKADIRRIESCRSANRVWRARTRRAVTAQLDAKQRPHHAANYRHDVLPGDAHIQTRARHNDVVCARNQTKKRIRDPEASRPNERSVDPQERCNANTNREEEEEVKRPR